MDTRIEFDLPISGLKNGTHLYHFDLDKKFFDTFEDSPIQSGQISVDVTLDRTPNIFVLETDYTGYVDTICDRCAEPIKIPIDGTSRQVIQFGSGESTDESIIILPADVINYNVAQLLYEFMVLSLPVVKVVDDDSHQCNPEVLKYLKNTSAKKAKESTGNNPFEEALKKLKLKK